jgi:iron(III) transport system ATP-binding protein
VVLCVRRRALRFAAAGAGIAGRVLASRFLGDLVMLEIGVQGFEAPLSMLVREGEVEPRGADVHLALDPSGVLIFAAEGPVEGA